ncbi:hypothetical protein [Variovorax gossypii]
MIINHPRQYGRDDVDYHTWYSPWVKRLALVHTVPELQKMAGVASSEATRAAGTHLRAIKRTGSMQGNSMARAHSRNVVAAAGETVLAAFAALEIHELFPEHAKPLMNATMTTESLPAAASALVALLNEAMQFGYPLKNNNAYQDLRATLAATGAAEAVAQPLDVDALANEIRRVDGSHSLGAGALAEALLPFLVASHADAARPLADNTPDDLRAAGWTVAVHNDYRLKGKAHTFWLLTKGERFVKGEGRTDGEALAQVRAAVAALSSCERQGGGGGK